MKRREHATNLLAAAWASLASRPAVRPVEKILILGYGAIGDLIFFLPTVTALRAAYPKAKVTWVSNPYPTTDELLPATGLADEIWRWEAQGHDPEGRSAINARIKAAGFDLAVLTLGAPAHDFLDALASIPMVAGHERPWRGLKSFVALGDYARRAVVTRAADLHPGEHAQTRNLRLLAALGLPSPSPETRPALPVPEAAVARSIELFTGLKQPPVAFHLGPTGNQYAKMWAPEKFAALSKALADAWGAPLILVGSADEAEAERRFREAGGVAALSLVGRTNLLETFAVLQRCALLISNDTGLAKAAAALRTPTATLWGPSDPAEFRSPWDRDRHLDLRTGIWCAPCSWMGTPERSQNYSNCGHHDCLSKLEAGKVAAALLERWPRLAKS